MTPQRAAPTARSIRFLHASMIIGLVLFAMVAHFVLRRTLASSEERPAIVPPSLLALAVVGSVLALGLRRRVPRRSSDASADLFWRSAYTPALMVWTFLDGAGLLAILAYALTGAQVAIAVAIVAIIIFVIFNPAYFERR
jgi:hypothetical protein